MSSPSATYVYCLVRSDGAPSLAGAPAGLAHAGAPRAVPADRGRWLVVADAPLERYAAERIQEGLRDLEWVGRRAVEHEALVEHLLASGTVVPMKLFSLYLGDERAVADVRARSAEVDALLDLLQGQREWGLRVLVDPALAAEGVREQAARDEDAQASAGKAFLMRKKQVLDASRSLRGKLLERARGLYDQLAGLASDARSRPPAHGEGRLLLDASFLVPEGGQRAFHEAFEERARALRADGLELVLSGPWPGYNFVEPAP